MLGEMHSLGSQEREIDQKPHTLLFSLCLPQHIGQESLLFQYHNTCNPQWQPPAALPVPHLVTYTHRTGNYISTNIWSVYTVYMVGYNTIIINLTGSKISPLWKNAYSSFRAKLEQNLHLSGPVLSHWWYIDNFYIQKGGSQAVHSGYSSLYNVSHAKTARITIDTTYDLITFSMTQLSKQPMKP